MLIVKLNLQHFLSLKVHVFVQLYIIWVCGWEEGGTMI